MTARHPEPRLRGAGSSYPRAAAWLLVLAVFVAACSGQAVSDRSRPTREPSTRRTERAVQARATGSPHRIDAAFFGFNGASIVQTVNVDLLLDPTLQRQLATFPARLIRIPSGTAAQWLDWRSGKFIPDPSSPFASVPSDRRPITMHDWATLVKNTKATPVWDLNVLTSTLDDQIAMLSEAQHLGIPIRYIELGNELWDPRSIYPKVFPDGVAYAQTMNTWIPELRRRFPDARIAVCGADPSDAFFSQVFGERYRSWNTGLFATIRDADAVTFHPYWTLPGRADPGSDVPATLTAGLQAWDRFRTDTLPSVPNGMDVWLTEWNQAAWGSKAGSQIWAQALSVVAVGLGQLTSPNVTMSLVHDIVDGEPNPHDAGISITFPAFSDGARGSTPMARTALGIALPQLFGAAAPGSTITALDVAGTSRSGSSSGVRGVQITGPSPGALLVNLTATSVDVRLPAAMTGEWRSITLSAPAEATPGWVDDQKVRTTTADTAGTLTLPGYSIVRVTRS